MAVLYIQRSLSNGSQIKADFRDWAETARRNTKVSDCCTKGYSFLTCETECVLFLAVLEISVLPMG